MINETLLPQVLTEVQPPTEHLRIEASIEAIDQEADLAWEQMNIAYESGSESQKQNIDELLESYDTSAAEAAEKDEVQPSLSSFLEGADVPEGYRAGALAYESSMTKTEAAEAELEKHTPEKAAEVKAQAAKLTASLNYDKVVAAAFADDDSPNTLGGIRHASISLLYDVGQAIGVAKLLEQGGSMPSYSMLQSVERTLTSYADDWKEKGLLKEKTADSVETNGFVLSAEQITEIETHITDVYAIRNKYKNLDGDIQRKTQHVLRLSHLVQAEQPNNVTDLFQRNGVIYNEGLSAAINRRIVQKLGELPSSEFETDITSGAYAHLMEQARMVNAAEALQDFEISGSFENLPFAYSEDELKLFLLSSIPVAAFIALKRLQFRTMTKEEDKEDNTLGFHTWSEELGGSEIVISVAKVREHYEYIRELMGQDKDAEAAAQLSAKNTMLHAITHEFGHALHEALPVAALKRWDEQRTSDRTNITAYVRNRFDNNHHHRYMEDFADSMAMFINKPEVLTVISPIRFNAMQQIFEEYMPLYPEVTKKLQERRISIDKTVRASKGTSDAKLKSLYLSHEAA
jgi:hypothetical protein